MASMKKPHVVELPHWKIALQNTPKLLLLLTFLLIILTIVPIYLFDNPFLLPYLTEKKNPYFSLPSSSPVSQNLNEVKTGTRHSLFPSSPVTQNLNEATTGTPSSPVTQNLKEVETGKPKTMTTAEKNSDDGNKESGGMLKKRCNLFKGEWIPFPEGPYYTNETCGEIYDHQNCLKFGKPDTGFLRWRWKPNDCELTRFDPVRFLEIVRGKSMAFVGDSMARNQLQSLLCLLSKVPVDVSYLPDGKTKQWQYTQYNFTIIFFWSPLLVKTTESIPKSGPLRWPVVNLFIDEFDESWTNEVYKFQYVIISAAQWFWRPSMIYEKGTMVGCADCKDKKIKDLTLFYGYNRAFQTAFRAMYGNQNFKGITFLRTYSPGHFDNGAWNEGGTCTKTVPYKSNERKLEGFEQRFYLAQLDQFRIAENEGKKRDLKFRLLDTTHAMLLRPDGHPGLYGHPPEEKRKTSDCVHWCLPGPTDTWNEFLLHMLEMDTERLSQRNH